MIAQGGETLGPPPSSVVDHTGAPMFGTYLGPLKLVDLSGLRGPWRRGPLYRFTHRKRWLWFMIATPEVAVAAAIVDASYAANGFLIAADLDRRAVICDRGALGIPAVSVSVADMPNDGAKARFTARGLRIRASRRPGSSVHRIEASVGDLSLDAELDVHAGPRALALIAPVEGGTVNVTQKSGALPSRGVLRLKGHTYSLDGGFGGFDYTNGLLARHTAWRWAFASGRADDGSIVGFNIVEGFNESATGNENVVWADGRATLRGRAHFTFDPASTGSPWRITTEDGGVDLLFEPIGAHREDRDLVLVRSHFVQVVGTFKGTLVAGGRSLRVGALAGVTEDQDVIW